MTGYAVLAGSAAALVVAGIWVLITGVVGRGVTSAPFRRRLTRVRAGGARSAARRRTGKLALAGAAGTGVWVLSGWPVAGVMTGLAVVGLPYFFGAGKIAARRIERLEALEEWVRRLADSMSAGTGTVQTLVASAARAPGPIKAEVTQLATRLSTPRLDRRVALRAFADELDDSLADMVVLALEIAVSAGSSAKVPDVLRAVATEVSDEVRARRKVETDRAEPRSEARTIVIVQALFVVGVSLLTSYTKVYGTPSGQLVLGAFALLVVGALWLLRRFSLGDQPPRILSEQQPGGAR